MSIRVLSTDLRILNMRTRMPFKYGIATLTALPHLIVRAEVEIDGRRQWGVAADGLPPKWFTKDPGTTFREDLADMLAVIRAACDLAVRADPADSVFSFCQCVYSGQRAWAASRPYPPLLWNFGFSLIERAVIDAFCRASRQSFAAAVRRNTLAIRLGEQHEELAGAAPADLLPPAVLRSMIIRHTVGLADPLTDDDIPAAERLSDGLPQSLESAIRAYGLTHFKFKLTGEPARDRPRLRRLASILEQHVPGFAYTLDGNESFRELPSFCDFWRSLSSDPALERFLSRLIFVEQPLHRDVALSEPVRRDLLNWPDRPPMIIDESDNDLSSLPAALDSGYIGISHKNCKGVFKGIANACLIAHRRNADPRLVLSGEDLASVGPVALLQDLAVLATLGVTHAERNGHHYFLGLSAFPRPVQDQVLTCHRDLYAPHAQGFPVLSITAGRISIASVVDAPLGVAPELDFSGLVPLESWDPASLDDSA